MLFTTMLNSLSLVQLTTRPTSAPVLSKHSKTIHVKYKVSLLHSTYIRNSTYSNTCKEIAFGPRCVLDTSLLLAFKILFPSNKYVRCVSRDRSRNEGRSLCKWSLKCSVLNKDTCGGPTTVVIYGYTWRPDKCSNTPQH